MKSMYFLLSPNCNLKCKYCFQLENPTEVKSATFYHSQPRLYASRKLVKDLAAYCRSNEVTHVEFFGGEPLLYQDTFIYALDHLCDTVPDMTIGVVTNGTLINEEIMTRFEDKPVSILLSLDGGRERHDATRGGFDKIAEWIPRLAATGRITVAMQAGVVAGLADGIRDIWAMGLKQVYINVIENHDWYTDDDPAAFEQEYEEIINAMLEGEGELSCALQLLDMLQQPILTQGCGIVAQGLACDWHGLLFPCHRAMEIGPQLAIGDIYKGVDDELNRRIRTMLHDESFGSESAKKNPLVSYCPVAVYQKHRTFSGEWSAKYCAMIASKAKLVSKYHPQLTEFVHEQSKPMNRRGGLRGSRTRMEHSA